MFTDKTDFLVNTLDYYTEDTNRRCVKGGVHKGCFYSPENANKVGISDGCAIGRWMTPENQVIADSEPHSGIDDLFANGKESLFPEWLLSLGTDFLSCIQGLHDNYIHWSKHGLSKEGKDRVKFIIREFSLDENKLQKFL